MCHKRAYELYVAEMEASGTSLVRSEADVQDSSQQTITQSFSQYSAIQEAQIKKKMEVSYFVAKNELPYTLYEKIINLEKHHNVDIGDTYINSNQCGIFIDYHGEYLADKLKKDLCSAKFYSVLTDGSTDSYTIEKEVIYVLYFDPISNPDRVDVKLTFLYVKDIPKADAIGVKSAIEKKF
ncbi:hypothetical protein SNE40_004419 [Patella caerulea]